MARAFDWSRASIRSLALQTPGWKVGVTSRNGSFFVYPPAGEAIAIANRHNPTMGGATGRAAQNTIARLKRAGLDPDRPGTELPPAPAATPEEEPVVAKLADIAPEIASTIYRPDPGPAIALLEEMVLELTDAVATAQKTMLGLTRDNDAQKAVNERYAANHADLRRKVEELAATVRDQAATIREQQAAIAAAAARVDPLAAFRGRLNG